MGSQDTGSTESTEPDLCFQTFRSGSSNPQNKESTQRSVLSTLTFFRWAMPGIWTLTDRASTRSGSSRPRPEKAHTHATLVCTVQPTAPTGRSRDVRDVERQSSLRGALAVKRRPAVLPSCCPLNSRHSASGLGQRDALFMSLGIVRMQALLSEEDRRDRKLARMRYEIITLQRLPRRAPGGCKINVVLRETNAPSKGALGETVRSRSVKAGYPPLHFVLGDYGDPSFRKRIIRSDEAESTA